MNILIDNRWEDPTTGIGKVYLNVMNAKPSWVNESFVKGHSFNNPLSPLLLGSDIRNGEFNAFWSPSFIPPYSTSNVPYIFTIHDLIHLYYHSIIHKVYFKTVISYLGSRAFKIITVSHFTKNEIVKHLGIPSSLIEVVYNGVDSSYLTNERKLSFNRPYILYAGNKRVHKNLDRLLLAFNKAKLSKDIALVLTGKEDEVLNDKITKLNLSDRVIFTGFLAEEDMPALYKGALAIAYVSLMEGFGLPILEGMASQTPVLTSNVSSLPEIAGEGALLVDPFDVDDICRGLEMIVYNQDLRSKYISIGNQRVNEFSWENCSARTWDIIEQMKK